MRSPLRPRAHRRSRSHLLAGIACLGLVGCGRAPYVHLHVCGDVAVPSDVDTVGVSLLDENQKSLYEGTSNLFTAKSGAVADGGTTDGGTSDGGVCEPGTAQTLPLTFDLTAGQGNMWVVVRGFRDGVPVETVWGRVTLLTHGSADVSIGLTKDCLGVKCAYGQTCIRGQCEITKFGGDPKSCQGAPDTGSTKDSCKPVGTTP